MPIGMAARMKNSAARMKNVERLTAEYIRDFAEELALMADGIKLANVGRALQHAALLAQNAADKLGASRSNLRGNFRRKNGDATDDGRQETRRSSETR